MAKRGRKSAASLVVVPAGALPQRPPPATALDAAGQRRWREIVDALPADYWRPSDLMLLEDMIRTEQYVRDCDALIKKRGQMVNGARGIVTNPAVTARTRYLATIATIQRALRLCPSTRLDKQSAKLRQTTTKRPWQA